MWEYGVCEVYVKEVVVFNYIVEQNSLCKHNTRPLNVTFQCKFTFYQFVVVQSLSHVWLFAAPWTAACQAPLSSTISWSLLKFMSIESVMLSNHLILCCPFSFCLQSFPAPRSFPMDWFFSSGGQSIEASTEVGPKPKLSSRDYVNKEEGKALLQLQV